MWWGFVYVTFVVDVFAARSSVGEQAARQAPALCWMLWSNASHKRRHSQDNLIHHSDHGSQYLLIKYI
jgi:putative transposase